MSFQNSYSDLNATLSALLDDWSQPGLAVGIVDKDQTTMECAGVLRVGDDQQRVDPFTFFASASVSKTFAAASIGILVHRGLVALDDPVCKHLSYFKLSDDTASREATIRDLLSNRLGLQSSEGRHRRCATSRKDLILRMGQQTFRHSLREGFGYCSDGFTCIGAIVEAVTGLPWETFAGEEIWRPLGMTRTNANLEKTKRDKNAASPHLVVDQDPIPINWAYEEAATPAGGVNSCVHDLLIWAQAMIDRGTFQGHELFSHQLADEIFSPQTPEVGPFCDDEFACILGRGEKGISNPSYGLGWYLHEYKGTKIAYHTGSIDGFRSFIGIQIDTGFAVVVLANADNAFLPRALFQHLLDKKMGIESAVQFADFHAYQKRVAVTPILLPDPSCDGRSPRYRSAPKTLCGKYREGTGFGESEIFIDDGRLILKAGATSFDLRERPDGSFAAYRQFPYAPIRQFIGRWEYTADGHPMCFITDEAARFEKCPE
ncbi:MAG: serine hydrolase domain-containing protein [Pseudomonadota bacterium]